MKTLKVEALKNFIETCQAERWPTHYIIDQLLRFAEGQRGVELHDMCMILLDGTNKVLTKE